MSLHIAVSHQAHCYIPNWLCRWQGPESAENWGLRAVTPDRQSCIL
jgi:hypothetical protein